MHHLFRHASLPGAPPEGAFTLADISGIGVVVHDASGAKCERCWRVLTEVGTEPEHPDLCHRCTDVVGHLPAVAQ